MSRAGWNSLPRPARSASNPEVKAGLPRMALPFVGCREASSSLVARSSSKRTSSFGCPFSFVRSELATSTHARSAYSIRGEAGFLRMAVVLTSSISLRFVCCQTFVHFAARPLPTETAPLGFGGDPSFVGCREAGSSLVARSGSETSCLTRIPALWRGFLVGQEVSSLSAAIRCAAVGGFAALRMRRAPCGCCAGFAAEKGKYPNCPCLTKKLPVWHESPPCGEARCRTGSFFAFD